MIEHLGGHGGAGALCVFLDEALELGDVLGILHRFEFHHLHIAIGPESGVRIPNVRHAAGHTSGKITTGGA